MLPGDIKLDSIWGKRIVRLWVGLFLPASAICGYLAYDQHLATFDVNYTESFYSETIKKLDAEIIEVEQNGKVILPGQKGNTTIVDGQIVRDGIYQSNEAALAALESTKSNWERERRQYHATRLQHGQTRDKYVGLAIVIALIPAMFLLIYRFAMWLWAGRK